MVDLYKPKEGGGGGRVCLNGFLDYDRDTMVTSIDISEEVNWGAFVIGVPLHFGSCQYLRSGTVCVIDTRFVLLPCDHYDGVSLLFLSLVNFFMVAVIVAVIFILVV